MFGHKKVLYKGKTNFSSYEVVDMVYEGRKARVLFTGDREAAFSGMPLDGGHNLLFDYIQRLFELVAQTRPRQLLLIGGGVHTLSTALLNSLPDIKIDVVEIDSGLDNIATRFFGFRPNHRLHVFHSDGKDYLQMTGKKYDMIIIDAFSNLYIPQALTSQETARLCHDALAANGITAMNIISAYKGRAAAPVMNLKANYQSLYKSAFIYPADSSFSLWSSQNFILIAEKGRSRLPHGLRFEALPD